MLVVTRFRVPEPEGEAFRADLETARDALAERPGFESAHLGRNVDEPELWTMVTVWADVGSYRRALGAYEVKLRAVPLLGRALDEPSAYETLDGPLNTAGAREL
ncbi:antibiotic biosynthesis monooxygenase [Nocardioides mangrovicus]|uniref:Antibiotic biosynthesis monooxygenase n=1 Tax=Nocardioides mangrovicus TaxID=2478913 RepID=A0A3L8P589_9ACTN|nr:antibiotic biosynthesis monooxygenase family protein [Nocardioides mangrovicus]RLV49558.1 antibiotic biosynthesis monooxygenase [Nocardioides mangrovicus]